MREVMRFQGIRRGRYWTCLTAIVLLAPAAFAGEPASESGDVETRRVMSPIFDAVQDLLLLGLDAERWAAPASRSSVEAALAVLEARSSQLAGHDAGRSESFGFYSQALAAGALELETRYRSGDFEQARGQLFQLVETCVGCHSRRSTPRDSRLSEGFARDPRFEKLPPDERVRLETAIRQYDAALQTYEEIFESSEYTANDLDMIGILDDYVALNFQLRADTAALRRNLASIANRTDTAPGLALDIRRWIEVLDRLPDLSRRAELTTARGLVASARKAGKGRGDRPGLVEYLAAGTLLHSIVEDPSREALERAEAYYWLGVVESQVGSVFWPAPEEFYLESAIRLAPNTDISSRAFVLLEEIVSLGFTGSGGTRIPPQVRLKLDSLRALSGS
jgi:hypothetical protein